LDKAELRKNYFLFRVLNTPQERWIFLARRRVLEIAYFSRHVKLFAGSSISSKNFEQMI
jgi:hypothetical protein